MVDGYSFEVVEENHLHWRVLCLLECDKLSVEGCRKREEASHLDFQSLSSHLT